MHDVKLPLRRKPPAVFNKLRRKTIVQWKGRKQKNHAQCVIDISNSVDKSRVSGRLMNMHDIIPQNHSPLFDNMVQTIHRLVILQTFGTAPLSATKGTGQFFGKSFMLPKLFEDWLMGKICDIFHVIKRGRGR